AWNRYIQVAADGVVAGAVRVRFHGNDLSVHADLWPRALVPLLGLLLPVRPHALVNRDMNLVVARIRDVDRAMLVIDAQATPSGKGLLQVIGVAVGVPAPGQVLQISVLTKAAGMPIHCLAGDETENYDHHHEHDAASTDTARALSRAVRLLVFEYFDNAPNDQQDRPVMREPQAEVAP